mgnify:CR=1 FL=1
MLSYIVFIFICFLVRVYCEFPMWNTLVAAISFSSSVFAFADFYAGLASTELAVSRITKNLFTQTDKSLEYLLKKLDKELAEKLTADLSTKLGHDVNIEAKSNLTKLSEENNKLKTMYKENDRRHKRYSNLANLLNFLGYLSFFVALVFQSVSSVLSSYLDLLSVFAFGMILLTQYMTGYYEERIEKQKLAAKNVHDTTKEYIDAQMHYIDSMIQLE